MTNNRNRGTVKNQKLCPTCGKFFIAQRLTKMYCSRSCRDKWNRLRKSGTKYHSIDVLVQ